MDPTRLRPLHLGEPLEPQLRQRAGVVWVASAILLGLTLFVLALFVSFGRAELGLLVGGGLFGLPLGWIWWADWRLRRAVKQFQSKSSTDEGEF